MFRNNHNQLFKCIRRRVKVIKKEKTEGRTRVIERLKAAGMIGTKKKKKQENKNPIIIDR